MKRFRFLLATFLVAGLLLGTSPICADDGDGVDVDIVVVGDGSDVDLDVIGDDTNTDVSTQGGNTVVVVNGRNVAELLLAAAARHGGDFAVVVDGWSRYRIEEVIFPWMERTTGVTDLVIEGLAKNIVLSNELYKEGKNLGRSVDELESETQSIEEYAQSIEEQVRVLEGRLEAEQITREQALEIEHQILVAYIDTIEQEYKQKLTWMFLISVSLIGILVILCIVNLRRRRD